MMAGHASNARYQTGRNSVLFLFEGLFFMMTSFAAVARRVGASGKLKKSSSTRMCENAPFCENILRYGPLMGSLAVSPDSLGNHAVCWPKNTRIKMLITPIWR